jgi:hypothetical protein
MYQLLTGYDSPATPWKWCVWWPSQSEHWGRSLCFAQEARQQFDVIGHMCLSSMQL